MVTLSRSLSLCLLSLLLACSPSSTSQNADPSGESTDAGGFEEFGASFEAGQILSYDELLRKMSENDSLSVTVQGRVQAVCQAKGCWMNIGSEQALAEEMMVKFKDYGFFVPKDISGREVVMQGKAYREVTPVDELRHLAQDAGKSSEEIAAITDPKVELKFMASGVRLLAQGDD